MRRIAAASILGGLWCFYIWVESKGNPADLPSGWHGIRAASLDSAVPRVQERRFQEKASRGLGDRASCLPIFVHLFSGPRRDGDLEEWVLRRSAAAGIQLMPVSMDLELGPQYDLRFAKAWSWLFRMAQAQLIGVAFSGFPCRTFSRVRFLPGGPRPLRTRQYPYGVPWLSAAEKKKCQEDTFMAENSAALFSLIGRHGAHGLENPQDPGIPPYPSAWLLEEIRSYTSQVWCSAVDVDLCRFDWISRKPTSIRGHFRGLERMGLRCNHRGGHAPLMGRLADGTFRTTPAQRYTSAFCAALSQCLVECYEDVIASRH